MEVLDCLSQGIIQYDNYVNTILPPVFIGVLLVGVLCAIVFAISSYSDKILSNNSQRIAALEQLNAVYKFHEITNYFEFVRYYDNKSNFSKIEPAYVMAAEFRANLTYYIDWLNKIEYNIIEYPNYINNVNAITVESICLNRGCIIPNWLLKMRERYIFNKKIAKPTIDAQCVVTLHYRSPKGKVNLQKQQCLSLNDIKTCIASMSRTKLDRYTYSQLAFVERGEVSDSLRYDILHRDGFCCVICGASATQGVRLHIDHIVPIAKGGKSVPSNLRTLCERCNIGKSDKIEYQPENNYQPLREDDTICPQCKSQLVYRRGKYGDFMGCSAYPRCRYTRKL